MSALLTASQLSKTFGNFTAVNKVDIHINAGEMIALAGHNGAGKSTLMKMLLGLLTPTSGSISINSHSATSLAARQLIGYLPETVALYPNMTGFETLDFFADLKHVSRERNRELLTRVGIIEAAKKRVGTYSKGMRQRLALARALIRRTPVLLLVSRKSCCWTNRLPALTPPHGPISTASSTNCAHKAPQSSFPRMPLPNLPTRPTVSSS